MNVLTTGSYNLFVQHEVPKDKLDQLMDRISRSLTKLGSDLLRYRFPSVQEVPKDIAQATFLRIMQKRTEFESKEHFNHLCIAVTTAYISDRSRCSAPETIDELNDQLRFAMSKMDSHLAELYFKHRMLGFGQTKLARQLGVRPDVVCQKLEKAEKILEEVLRIENP